MLLTLVTCSLSEDVFNPVGSKLGFFWGSGNGLCTEIINSWYYSGWVWHVGVTMINWPNFSFWTYLETQLMRLTGENENPDSLSHECFVASVTMLMRSGFQATYQYSWWKTLDAKRFTFGVPIGKTIFPNIDSWSINSDLSTASQDSQSVQTAGETLCSYLGLFQIKVLSIEDVEQLPVAGIPHFVQFCCHLSGGEWRYYFFAL